MKSDNSPKDPFASNPSTNKTQYSTSKGILSHQDSQANTQEYANKNLPVHIGFIMDGNGRWAAAHKLPRNMGHKKGVKTLETMLDTVFGLGIRYVSVYAFSTENCKRPKDEVDGLKKLMEENLGRISTDFIRKGIRLSVMGDLGFFENATAQRIRDLCNDSQGGKNGVLNFGLNYGGRAEIVAAVNKAVAKGQTVSEQSFSDLLFTKGLPDPDLIIRTGGEMRLSNFMLYQAAYSELYFSPVLWPDFDKDELNKALNHYAQRNRRYGTI